MSNISHITDIEEIVQLLRECDDAYFNAEKESPLTDRDYDALKRRAFTLDPANSYFVQVGSDVRGGKIKLPYTMGSLNQVYEGEILDWVSKYELGQSDVTITDKLDGVSMMLVYNGGKLSIAYSRGNGVEGADITRHVKKMPTVPPAVDADYLVVRAEGIMPNKVFDKKYSETFKNARNMTAGAMNRKETDNKILADIDVVAYEIVATDSGVNIGTKEDMLEMLATFGFRVANRIVKNGNELSDDFLSGLFKERQRLSEYELDGLVITANKYSEVDKLSNSSSINPEHSVKYKVLDESAVVETFVTDVIWEVSKSGYLKPRVEIIPVELFGTTVKYATGFNAKYIKDNGIGRGSKVRITKAGMVIPYIVETVIKTDPKMPPESFGEWEFNDTGVEAVLKDKESESIVFKQVLDFFETYKIDLLKEANLLQVWNVLPSKIYDEAICDICDLTETEWVKLIGANGSRIYASIVNRLGNSAPETFYGAVRYMGVGFGVRKAKALLEGIQDIYVDVKNLTVDDVIAKDGFDTKTATMVIAGIPKTLELMDRLTGMGVLDFVVQQKTSELSSVNVVMTGFRDSELHSTIESMGGKVSSGVSKKTTHLLCLDPSSKSGKMQKARELGVKVMTPDEFKQEHGI